MLSQYLCKKVNVEQTNDRIADKIQGLTRQKSG